MSLAVGDKLGPYEILAPIGAGGMGEVYRARDTRLGREVAIKVSHERFSERFEKEAHAIASLNHTNLCHLYDVGSNYLVMELVGGETLRGPLDFTEALPVIRQLIDGIEAAHDRNIVHRDLKPANIKITPEGVVKILDFGLAKATSPEPESATENSPTMTMGATVAGTILGTAAYMSPEQAKGKTADKRSDIWSFGVVVYELLTGKKPFAGESVVETLGAVINQEPDWSAVPERTLRLLKWCLEKDRQQRLQAIGDARRVLEEPPAIAEAVAPTRRGSTWMFPALAAPFVLAFGALAIVHFRERPPVAELARFQIPLPANQTFPSGLTPEEVSPDGRKLAFAAVGADGKNQLWIRSFDSLDARPLPGADTVPSPAPFFWSFDSRFLAFRSPDNKLKKVDVSGGPAQTLCDVSGDVGGGSWSRDGVILFGGTGGSGVMRVSEVGGTPIAVTAMDPARKDFGHVFPKLLPDGRHFLYFRVSTTPGNSGIFVGAIDAKPSEQSSKPLLLNEASPEYYVPSGDSRSGHLLFYREGTVMAQGFNPNKLELSGDPIPVAEQVGNLQGLMGFFSASTNGLLIYVGGNSTGNAQLTWFDRQGKNLGTVGEPGIFNQIALSRDGKQAAVSRVDSGEILKANLWLLDLTRGGVATRFTFDAAADVQPVFSPDGSRMVFSSSRDGMANLYQKLTSGARDEVVLLKTDEAKYPNSWSRDGRFLLYTVQNTKTRGDVWILPMEGSQKPMLFQGTEFNEAAPQFSPDGRWIAYQSDESGHTEIYVREFSLSSDGKPEPTAKHQISNGGGIGPRWGDDGKELVYVSLLDLRTVLSVEITTKPAFQSSQAKALFQVPAGVQVADTVDGKRFLAAVRVGPSGPQQFTVVQNWQAGLKK